ncbi:MAG: deoxyribodipyrimidine photo-lyase [Candidatus Babeliaceae bacterium]|jgi:deoxyribodipyrimidine photo-lyase
MITHPKKHKKTLFIFRRDLRLDDNIGLIEAIKNSEIIIPMFNFDPMQIGSKNAYRSMHAIEFMIESLHELHEQLKEKMGKLYIFYGDPTTTIKSIIKDHNIDAVFINLDYTPFSMQRDAAITELCKQHAIHFQGHHDALLIGDPDAIKNSSGTTYRKYTAFYRAATQQAVAQPKPLPHDYAFYTGSLMGAEDNAYIFKKITQQTHVKKKLQNIKKFKEYETERNFPALDATTHLSAAHKFGTISIRQSYHAIAKTLGTSSQLIAELYWRDFFTYFAYHSPHVFGGPFYKKYEQLAWSSNKKNFNAWRMGTTGFPIVDAGMRQMNATGFMHNRVRMIVASFLVKDLHINWLWGERYFATQLTDYDPAINNGNWQWIASTGSEAQPYFRIFNPWLQQKKYDPQCLYIKKWAPELQNIPNTALHNWHTHYHNYTETDYPAPMVNHEHEKEISISLYKKIA